MQKPGPNPWVKFEEDRQVGEPKGKVTEGKPEHTSSGHVKPIVKNVVVYFCGWLAFNGKEPALLAYNSPWLR